MRQQYTSSLLCPLLRVCSRLQTINNSLIEQDNGATTDVLENKKINRRPFICFCQTWGCRYWTVQKINNSNGDTSNVCTLKKWKGQLVHKEGYISGSLPSACCKYQYYYSAVPHWLIRGATFLAKARLHLIRTKLGLFVTI